MGVVSSARAAGLAEIRPGVSHPDKQQEDSLSSRRHLPGQGLFFPVTEPLRPSSCPCGEGRQAGGAPGLHVSYL